MNLVYIEYDFIVYLVRGNWNDFFFYMWWSVKIGLVVIFIFVFFDLIRNVFVIYSIRIKD